MKPSSGPVPPGGTLGIVGGGQLGRMLALAAARLGYRAHVLAPEADAPAAQVAERTIRAEYDDPAALDQFASDIDIATYEFENVPAATAAWLAARLPVLPDAQALATAQDRLPEKDFLNRVGAPTTPYRAVDDRTALDVAISAVGLPAVLKARRFGYDGKGQALIRDPSEADAAWAAVAAPAILEAFCDFEREISVVIARGRDGATAAYVPVENRHVEHILDTTIAPAPIAAAQAEEAQAIAARIVQALSYVGVMGVEMFVARDGGILVNEVAPRVHNSGHWTLDACITSQFEQHVRAVMGLPLGAPGRHGDAVMRNLVGRQVNAWPALLADGQAKLHLYGKHETRPGRKMGHVTWVFPSGTPAEQMLARARR